MSKDSKKRKDFDGKDACGLCGNESQTLHLCGACTTNGCDDCMSSSRHPLYGKARSGNLCCIGNGGRCPTCMMPFRTDENVQCIVCKQEVPSCDCYIKDVCRTCLVPKRTEVKKKTIKFQPIPGSANTLKRQVFVDAPINNHKVPPRKSTPACLSAPSNANENEDIGDMRLFDRGHIISLDLNGTDHSHLITPMNPQFNRNGKWRQMETTIGDLIGGGAAWNIADERVTMPTKSKVTVSPGTKNALNVVNRMEVRLFYDDTHGDGRIPVWFHVKLMRNTQMVTHFSLGNRGVAPATVTNDTAHGEFRAAKKIFEGLDRETLRGFLFDKNDLDHYVLGEGTPSKPPNQLLQFMWEVNHLSQNLSRARVFSTMDVGTQSPSTAYDDFQRHYLRLFNRWKNDGQLLSDVSEDELYEGETADVWAELDEQGGKAAPEVDHVFPSYQSGSNSYLNARLVSFQHNHAYREKKTIGAQPVHVTLTEAFRTKAAGLLHKGEIHLAQSVPVMTSVPITNKRKSAVACIPVPFDPHPLTNDQVEVELEEWFSDEALFDAEANHVFLNGHKMGTDSIPHKLRHERQGFLKAEAARKARQALEKQRKPIYVALYARHAQAVDQVTGTLRDHEGNSLQSLIDAATLCEPSDVIGSKNADTSMRIEDTSVSDAACERALQAMKDLLTAMGKGA
ncbi:DNA/RNA non-specific endonuclease [Pseudomonas japonica]|uniref:DNA/RNA non-specific endonuclease n=1 Tax=Pseudomonas japonica TaxID=256466 RepID=A0A239KJ11_9PSED|nr:DNA/RNA non-specific endonuclease [Pseudomonas japonica]SNT18151.1 DNA/RNA non-specific endonuclease [Pseudomonas japonica]